MLRSPNASATTEQIDMITIYKYTLQIGHAQRITIPGFIKVLYTGLQSGVPCIWALVDTEKELKAHLITVHGTGHPVLNSLEEYVGTVQIDAFVWHIFMEK